jgi:predicted GTPase
MVGFDSARNKVLIREAEMIPVIKPNLGARKDRGKIYAILNEFELEPLKPIYKEHHNIERCFAWEDTYRKMVISYEKLQYTFLGFKYLVYLMINFRDIFN